MKRGRPNVASKKNRTARVNFDDDSYEELSYLSEKSGRSRADILREAFEIYDMYVGSFLKKKGD